MQVSHSHWVTVSNIGCQSGCVKIYDSLPNCDVPTCTKEQIAALLIHQQKDITIEFPTMQVQSGSADCGLFALAFATTLCAGNNPAHVNYTQHLLRAHLYECFIQNSISPFPEAARRKKLLEPRGQVTYEYFVCVDYWKMARWSSVANVWSGTTGIVLMLQRTSGIMMLCGIVVRANSSKYFKLCMFVVLSLLFC